MEDPAVAEIFQLVERIDPADHRDALHGAVRRGDFHLETLPGPKIASEAPDGDSLVAFQSERLPGGSLFEDE